jgi:cyclopropane-fatty-acyl-phospholipid synthase
MTDVTFSGGASLDLPAPGLLDRVLRRQVMQRLVSLTEGALVVHEGSERHALGNAGSDLRAEVRVRDPGFWPAVALRGSVGAGESYMDGAWDTDDLAAVMRIMVRNRAALEDLDGGMARLALPFLKLFHRLRRNDRSGSRRNIAAHYDLGNDFYALWLDETLTYSAGIYESQDATLADAQTAKLDRICRKLDLGPEDHVIEIGTGWGSFALHAAGRYGCRVTTTTISKEQHERASERVRAAGLADHVEIRLSDYRDLTGTYDKLVSIEMIEAVGYEFLDEFFATCARLLKEDGTACIQAITIADRFHDEALRNVDFIQRYIFPGCYIPSVGSMTASIARATDLTLTHIEDIGMHYAATLRAWRERFLAVAEQVRGLGFDERFMRMWEFYLAYCEGGFAERQLGDVHLLLAKPRGRVPPPLPAISYDPY